jgi:hypothetical protein
VISVAENSNKLQETRFWKENSVKDVVTLRPTAQATLQGLYNNMEILYRIMVVIQWLLFFEVLLQARPVVLSPGTTKTTEDPIGLPLFSVVNGQFFSFV